MRRLLVAPPRVHAFLPMVPVGLFDDVRHTVRLATPLMAAQLAVIAFGLVDTVTFAMIGVDVLAAGALAVAVFTLVHIFCIGVLRAVGNQVAWAHGDGNDGAIREAVEGGLLIALVLGVMAALGIRLAEPLLRVLNQPTELIEPATTYMVWAGFGIVPSLIYTTFHGLIVGVSRPAATTVITFLAVLLKAGINGVVILSAVEGYEALKWFGLSTTVTFSAMVAGVVFYCLCSMPHFVAWPKLSTATRSSTRETLRLGLPIGFTYVIEAGLFSGTALIVGSFGAVALAAHQVANQCAHLTYTLAVGISHAASVRVGYAAGRDDFADARRIGLQTFLLGAAVMSITALVFAVFGEDIAYLIIRPRTQEDYETVKLAGLLLIVAGTFQWFDGLQIIAMGALRGLKDPVSTLRAAIIGYWAVGLAGAWALARVFEPAAMGAWIGIGIGLAVAAAIMLARFNKLTSQEYRGGPRK